MIFNKELVEKVYNKTIQFVLREIEPNYVKEVAKNYILYVNKVYSCVDPSDEELLNKFINRDIEKWKTTDKEARLSIFVNDYAFDEIRKISKESLDLAIDMFMSQKKFILSMEMVDNYKNRLNELLPKVLYFNKDLATILVSDAFLDFDYLNGNTEVCSLRLGHIIQDFEKEK